jgi:hypothetical protein
MAAWCILNTTRKFEMEIPDKGNCLVSVV